MLCYISAIMRLNYILKRPPGKKNRQSSNYSVSSILLTPPNFIWLVRKMPDCRNFRWRKYRIFLLQISNIYWNCCLFIKIICFLPGFALRCYQTEFETSFEIFPVNRSRSIWNVCNDRFLSHRFQLDLVFVVFQNMQDWDFKIITYFSSLPPC